AIDTNGDGVPDFVVFNAENGGFGASGQNVVFIANLATGAATPVFFTDADLNSGNVIFTVPMANLGVAPGTTINFSVAAFDNYFTGSLTDEIDGMRFTPGSARFEAVGSPSGTVPSGSRATQPISFTTVPDAKTSESALLLLYRRNAGIESEVVKVR